MSLQTTTWQTVGPYFHVGLRPLFQQDVAGEGARGKRINVIGRVVDGDGIPIQDAVIEVWQANTEGKYAHSEDRQDKFLEAGFRGFGRIPTDEEGFFHFTTIKPGTVPGPDGKAQAPHLVIGLLMRGLLRGLVTRAYFPDDALNANDPILQLIEPQRRETLMLRYSPERDNVLVWEIHMQGEAETVFLDF